MKVSIDPESGEPRGEPVTVLGGASVQEFSLSADGRQLAYTKAPPQQRIWAMTLEGPASRPTVRARELTTGTSIYGTPDVSPDGRWVAFARNEGGMGNLYLTPFERFEPRPLVASPADEWSPRFSPDGRQVAYAVRDSGSPGILVVEVATGQVQRVASDGLAPLGVIAWMPNGREVVFPLDLGHHYAIEDLAGGGADTLVSPDSVLGFHLTVPGPTGTELAVSVVRGLGPSPLGDIWVVKRSGEPVYRIDTGKLFTLAPLRWTADGWLYFLSSATTLARVRPGTGNAAAVATLPQPCSDWQTSLSADARRLVCVVSHTEPDIGIAENFEPEARR
jgi:dipeptidyl aminopeptidase/acylaminoacyl peptidase